MQLFKYILNKLKKDLIKDKEISINNNISKNKSNRYPQYLSDKLSDKEYMDSIINSCYENNFIDLKKYHKKSSYSEYFTGKINDLDSLKIDKSDFGNDKINEFWVIKYNNLVYVFNGELAYPCTGIIKRESDCLFFILYIPGDNEITLSNSLYLDILFYEKISNSIQNSDDLYDFLLKLNFYISRCSDEYDIIVLNMRYVFNNNLDFKNKITILDKLNSLEFLTRLFFSNIGYITFDIDKLLYSFYNYNRKNSSDIIKITKTSNEILSQNEIIKLLVEKLTSIESVLDFFDFKKIEEYLSKSKLNTNTENNSSMLSEHFFIFNYIYKNNNSNRNYNEEKIITNQIREFKINYYRTITPKLREIESNIRVNKGFNIVGSYTNESILFIKIKETYLDYKVISQGSPNWLGRQRIDIYFPELNIGIEYQGDQHFYPIQFFGGDEGLEQRKILDNRKVKLCIANDCKLFIVDKNYSFDNLKSQIDLEIENRVKK
jgi:hypothetical protein